MIGYGEAIKPLEPNTELSFGAYDGNYDFLVNYRRAAKKTIENEDGSITVEYDEELSKAWLEREKTESEYRMCKLRMGLERLGEKFWELWD